MPLYPNTATAGTRLPLVCRRWADVWEASESLGSRQTVLVGPMMGPHLREGAALTVLRRRRRLKLLRGLRLCVAEWTQHESGPG